MDVLCDKICDTDTCKTQSQKYCPHFVAEMNQKSPSTCPASGANAQVVWILRQAQGTKIIWSSWDLQNQINTKQFFT